MGHGSLTWVKYFPILSLQLTKGLSFGEVLVPCVCVCVVFIIIILPYMGMTVNEAWLVCVCLFVCVFIIIILPYMGMTVNEAWPFEHSQSHFNSRIDLKLGNLPTDFWRESV